MLLVDPADEPAERTLREALRREGWPVVPPGSPAACAVVVWSARGAANAELARLAAPFLERRRLLQILWQPAELPARALNEIEPPEPFRYYVAVIARHWELGGSDGAADMFANRSLGAGPRILGELARLGGLPRPRDRWNARIEFRKPVSRDARDVLLVERAGDDGRVLRRVHESGQRFLAMTATHETAIGNRWQILDPGTGEEILDEVEVRDEAVVVDLPERLPWWRRVRGG